MKKGKNITCECPRCGTKLKIYTWTSKDGLVKFEFDTQEGTEGEVLSTACICIDCRKDFDLSEALNLTVVTK